MGGAALAGAFLLRRMRRGHTASAEPVTAVDPRAAELRRKLDEARALTSERDDFESGETPVDRAADVDETIADRRRAVHEEGRAAAREMRSRADGD